MKHLHWFIWKSKAEWPGELVFQRKLPIELRIFRLVRWSLGLELCFSPASPDGLSVGLSKSSSVTSSSITLPQQSSPWDTDHAFVYIIIYADCMRYNRHWIVNLLLCVCIHTHRITGIHCFKKSPFGEEMILGSHFKHSSLWLYGRRVAHNCNPHSHSTLRCALS